MTRTPSIAELTREEERTRRRESLYRIKVYRGDVPSVMSARQRLDRLARAHKIALDRLRRARIGQ